MKLGMIGISHLSLNTGIGLSSLGHEVTFYDVDREKVTRINDGILPVFEPGLEDFFQENRERLIFTNDKNKLVDNEITYVAIDIKTRSDNTSDLTELNNLIGETAPYLKGTVVLHSQIPMGFSREISQKFENQDVKVFYQVETLIFGRGLERVLQPERYIVGCLDESDVPVNYHQLLSHFDCPVLYMNYESAELCKMAINMYLVSNVSTTNMLSEICENSYAKWDQIKEALKLDKRIGPYAYLNPGLGISGGNLERDLVSIKNMSKEFGTESKLIDVWFDSSFYRKDWVFQNLMEVLESKEDRIGILGLSYRKGTHSLKNSPSVRLIENLKGFYINSYDPQAKFETSYARQLNSAQEVIDRSAVLILMTPWEEFEVLDLSDFKGRVIIDPFKIVHKKNNEVDYYTLGEKTNGKS